MNKMFTSTGQAVHFSYIVKNYPVGMQSSLSGIKNAAKEHGISRINFDGMSPADIRIECDRIRRAVNLGLDNHEAAALKAKFSYDTAEKEAAMRTVANHLLAALADAMKDADMIHTLVRRHYIGADRPEWSLRRLENTSKISKSRLGRAAQLIELHIKQLEVVALDNLRRKFEERDLITKTEVA